MSKSKGHNTSRSSKKAKLLTRTRRRLPPASAFSSQPSKKAKLLTPTLLFLFGVSTLAYYLILAAIYVLFGERLASWLANPLFGIAVFFIAKWEVSSSQKDLNWRDYIKFRKLKIWKLIIVILTIFLVQCLAGAAAGYYLVTVQPDIETNGILEGIQAMTTTWGSLIVVTIGAVSAYFLGGYMAGKLCRDKYLAPYSHAAAGAFIYFSINYVWIQYLYICDCDTTPTQEDVGVFALLLPPTMLLSIFGAWVATKPQLPRSIDAFFQRIKARVLPPFQTLFSHPIAGLRTLRHGSVWSKVIATIIVGVLGTVGVYFLRNHSTTVQSCNSATISAGIQTRGEETFAWFEWGETPNLGNVTIKQRFTEDTDYSQHLVDLKENTTYYYKAMGSDINGTEEGRVKSFTTARCER